MAPPKREPRRNASPARQSSNKRRHYYSPLNADQPVNQGRRHIARLDLGVQDLVVSVRGDLIDVRLWTPTAGLKLPSKFGVSFPSNTVTALIAALRQARRVRDE